jgi:hypothetical protein
LEHGETPLFERSVFADAMMVVVPGNGSSNQKDIG